MIKLDEAIRQLTDNAEAIRALMQNISDEQAQWKPNSDTWSMREVMEHVYNEERMDFRKHMKEMLSEPPQPWGFGRTEYISVASCRQALKAFLIEREASLAWLKAMESPDWDRETQVSFGPGEEVMVFKVGDVFVSWVEHDFLHLRQMIELQHAWNVKQASPYSVRYAGGW